MRIRSIVFAFATAGCTTVSAEQQPLPAGMKNAAQFFADCSGVWDFQAGLMEKDGKPAAAEHLHNLGNGAQTSALYFYAHAHAADAGKPAPYGAWISLVEPRRKSSALRMRALYEALDPTLEGDMKKCADATELQERILNQMREARVRDEIESQAK